MSAQKPSKFLPGDVVSCFFPQEEDPSITDWRPALVIDSFWQGNQAFYRLVKITRTNNSHRFAGKWVTASSKEGRSMKLTDDSFIHYKRVASVPDFGNGNIRYRGTCPQNLFDEILSCINQ